MPCCTPQPSPKWTCAETAAAAGQQRRFRPRAAARRQPPQAEDRTSDQIPTVDTFQRRLITSKLTAVCRRVVYIRSLEYLVLQLVRAAIMRSQLGVSRSEEHTSEL